MSSPFVWINTVMNKRRWACWAQEAQRVIMWLIWATTKGYRRVCPEALVTHRKTPSLMNQNQNNVSKNHHVVVRSLLTNEAKGSQLSCHPPRKAFGLHFPLSKQIPVLTMITVTTIIYREMCLLCVSNRQLY